MDLTVNKVTWEVHVAIEFVLHDAAAGLLTSEPCYLMIPRGSYLPLAEETLVDHFGIALGGQHLWFSASKDTALKWHLPVGVLFDIFGPSPGTPWTVQVHIDSFPSGKLLQYTGLSDLQHFFTNRIKEAAYIKAGGDQRDKLSADKVRQLWSGLYNSKYEEFTEVNSHLMRTPNSDWFDAFPFCLYVVKDTADGGCTLLQVLQEPFPTVDEQGNPWSLKDFLSCFFGTELVASNPVSAAVVAPDMQDAAASATQEKVAPQARVVVQGIEPSLDTPVQWLAAHLAAPDNFCHVVVHKLDQSAC
eukprot:m.360825 g.360825  ORF g.360825 m.360825 type:complete len:302 (+) comp19182_c0_seq1:136-1041(+)